MSQLWVRVKWSGGSLGLENQADPVSQRGERPGLQIVTGDAPRRLDKTIKSQQLEQNVSKR